MKPLFREINLQRKLPFAEACGCCLVPWCRDGVQPGSPHRSAHPRRREGAKVLTGAKKTSWKW